MATPSTTAPTAVHSAIPLRVRDEPRLKRGELEFRHPGGTLFGELPKHTDARQGFIGDCYLLSALSALARSNPHHLKGLATDHGDDTYTFRFHRRLGDGRFSAESVRLDAKVPVRQRDGVPIYGRSQPGPKGEGDLWPLLAEKAYATWKGGYHVTGEGGLVEQTLEELTGQPTRLLYVAECDPEKLWALLRRGTREGWPTTVCTYGRKERPGIDELGFHPNHIVIFLGVHQWMGRRIVWLRDPFDVPATGKLALPDPHGVYTLPWSDFLNYFAEVHLNAAAAHEVKLPPYPRVTLLRALESSYVFHDLPPKALRQLASQFRRHTFQSGQVLHRAGDPSGPVDVLEYGNASIEIPDGRRLRRVALLRPGGTFGEVHAFQERPLDATLTAATDLALYRISIDRLREWNRRFPQIRERMERRFDVQIAMHDWTERPVTTLTVDSLLRSGQLVRVRKGQVIFSRGDRADGFYVVIEGAVALGGRAGMRTGRFFDVKPGGVFGEVDVIRHVTRLGSATAVTASVLLRVDLGVASEALQNFDIVRRQLDAVIARRDAAARGLRRHR